MPPKIDMAMFRALRDTALKLQQDTSIRAVILAGRGDAFCAGLDVKSVAANPINMVGLPFREGAKSLPEYGLILPLLLRRSCCGGPRVLLRTWRKVWPGCGGPSPFP